MGRCIMYGLHALMQSEQVQRRGHVVILNLKGYDLYKDFDRLLTKLVFRIMATCPVKLNAMHCVTGWSSTMYNIAVPALRFLAGERLFLRGFLHCGSSTDMETSLAPFGLGLQHVEPVFAGVVREMELIEAWLQERRRLEEKET